MLANINNLHIGAILCAALTHAHMFPTWVAPFRGLGTFFDRFTPKLPFLPLKPKGMSRNPDAVQEYLTDPLNHLGNIPLRTGKELAKVRLLDASPFLPFLTTSSLDGRIYFEPLR